MTQQDFTTALDILWHETEGPKITTDQAISELLAKALQEQGVQVIRVGRKPRSKNKFITFNLAVKKVVGMENMFLTEEDAQNWHDSKNRGLSTLMKAPDEAFDKVKTEDHEALLWWNQAFKLCHRLGGNLDEVAAHIFKHRGRVAGEKVGLL
jgi:hypothetical protein